MPPRRSPRWPTASAPTCGRSRAGPGTSCAGATPAGKRRADAMPDVLVLCYHAVSPVWPAALSVTPAALERQLGRLLDRGYRATTFAHALSAPPPGDVM